MKMYVHYLLPSFFSDIELELVSWDYLVASEVTGQEEEATDDTLVAIFHIGNSGYMSLGDKEHVDAGFGIDVIEYEVVIIFVYRCHRNLMGGKRTKKTHKDTVRN